MPEYVDFSDLTDLIRLWVNNFELTWRILETFAGVVEEISRSPTFRIILTELRSSVVVKAEKMSSSLKLSAMSSCGFQLVACAG
jgi:hypothetical protein